MSLEPDVEFLESIFQEQPGKYIALSRKKQGRWKDLFFPNLEEAVNWIKRQSNDTDVYFCPTKLTRRRRRKEYVAPSKFLWADLDEADPRDLKQAIKPTHAWESSPGRFQALWELDKAYSPQEIEGRNKGIAETVGADISGWDLTQVLRVPGTYNNKYPSQPHIAKMWIDHSAIRPLVNYPDASIAPIPDDEQDTSLVANRAFVSRLLRPWRHAIPKKVVRLLLSDKATTGKRSDMLWYIAHELIKARVPEDTAFQAIRNSVWNKYRGRRDEIQRLQHEIEEARKRERPQDEAMDRERPLFSIVDHLQLMASVHSRPNWLIEQFWSYNSHGIIAGEPKTFKSTLCLDMAISVASGTPLFGTYKVTEPGPVLVIQNENSDWIMQDRSRKICATRGLVGEMHRRIDDEIIVHAPPKLPIYYVNQQGFSFTDPMHTEFIEAWCQAIKPRMIVFDPLYLMFDGELNSSKDLNPVLSYLLYLKQEYKTAIVLIHHWNKGGLSSRGGQRMLGSTTLHGWTESAWYLSIRGVEIEKKGEEEEDEPTGVRPALAKLVMEREFRGSGIFPKVEMTVAMGEYGNDLYAVNFDSYKPQAQPKASRDDLEGDILNQLQLNGKASLKKLSELVGTSRRLVREVTVSMEKKGILKKVGQTYSVKG
jgi:hypothetical protein